jgi:membrane protease YdiL (CAAX protease family)
LFHAYKWWDLIGLLPVCLSLSFVAQKRQSTWPGIIAHFLFNGLGFIGLMVIMLGS